MKFKFFVTEIVIESITTKAFEDYQAAKEYYNFCLTKYKLIDIYISEVKEFQENQVRQGGFES
ncbi:MAG: hypothetical protein K0S93_38 [Nitrososphaeraceae archaeon]|jgi:hypothetical protein|nr:hypothetical protein [Nitrososphaeraceae archaeon]